MPCAFGVRVPTKSYLRQGKKKGEWPTMTRGRKWPSGLHGHHATKSLPPFGPSGQEYTDGTALPTEERNKKDREGAA
jgi:hypothetical protein